MADKFYSYLFSNNYIEKEISNDWKCFRLDKSNDYLFYSIVNKKIYVERKNYKGQPHIIPHWNYKNDKSYLAFCLTMDNDYRDNDLSAPDMYKRVKEIFYEQWPNKIYERFKELNITLSASKWLFNIIYNDNLYNRLLNKIIIFNYEFLFKGQNYDKIIAISNKKYIFKNNLLLVTFKYKKNKKIFLACNENNAIKFYFCDNYSDYSFFGRTKKITNNNHFIIVGAGSVGAEVIDCLVKSGNSKITIYDKDFIESHNTPRHHIGVKYSQWSLKNKAKLIEEFYKVRYPFIEIKGIDQNFLFNEKINKNDVVINTTGGTNNQRFSNFKKFLQNNKNIKLVDIFIEPYGAGAHMIIIDNLNSQIFNIDWDKRCVVRQDKDLRLDFEGCFISTLPYSYIPIKVSIPQLIQKGLKDKFINGHYSVFAVDISGINKKYLNKNFSKKIDHEFSGIIKW